MPNTRHTPHENRPHAPKKPSVRDTPAGAFQPSGIPRRRAKGASRPSGNVPLAPIDTSLPHTPKPVEVDAEGIHVNVSGKEHTLTRRNFLLGGAGVVGAAIVLGAGSQAVKTITGQSADVTPLTVSSDHVFTLDGCSQIDSPLKKGATCSLSWGTIINQDSDNVACCLIPTSGASPLTKVGFITLANGTSTTVLEAAVSDGEGYSILDARLNDSGMVWVEEHVAQQKWRIYSATFDGTNLGTPQMVDSGDASWQVPSIAVCGSYACWQVIPSSSVQASASSIPRSAIKSAQFGTTSVNVIANCANAPLTSIYGDGNTLVAAMPVDGAKSYCQLTAIDVPSDSIVDQLPLQSGMQPLEAGYGPTGFFWSFESIYSYGDGIANLGTYTPAITHAADSYTDLTWFRFARTPSMPPAWLGNSTFLVKSTTSVVGIDLANKTYYSISMDNGSENYGVLLAAAGTRNAIVTYENIDPAKTTAGSSKKYCQATVWSA